MFVFLAGTGAYLQVARGRSKSELSRFLITRGLWLIVLEFTWVRICVTFNVDYLSFLGMMQVIWVIGVSMIVLAALIHLPLRLVAAFGIAMIALHNLLDRFQVQGWRGPNSPVPGLWSKLFIILHQANEPFPVLGWPSPVLFRPLPVDSLGWSDGRRLRLWFALSDEQPEETETAADHGLRSHCPFYPSARH